MLRLPQLEELQRIMLEIPDLVRMQDLRAFDFAPRVLAWLQSLEKPLTATRQHQAGAIAALRSGLVAIDHGHLPSDLQLRVRATRSRVMAAAASQALQKAIQLVSPLVEDNAARFDEGAKLAQQIVALAAALGLMPRRDSSMTTQQYLGQIRAQLKQRGDLESGMVRLEGTVGSYDALALIDRALLRVVMVEA